MRNLINNLLHLAPQNTSDIVVAIALGLWFTVWLLLIMDILSQGRGSVWKAFWLVIVSIPVLGGALYGLGQILAGDWSDAFSWRAVSSRGKGSKKLRKSAKKRRKQSSKSGSAGIQRQLANS